MPELPEVEITRRSIVHHLVNKTITDVVIRNPSLRWPIPAELPLLLPEQKIEAIHRRAKYLLFDCSHGTLILHLGMSGSLRVLPLPTPPQRHDHFELQVAHATTLRFHDPRRFGAVLWWEQAVNEHPLLCRLGPEPLSDVFNTSFLYAATRRHRIGIKDLLMNQHVVAGLGNIYANEALFYAGINPLTAAHNLKKPRCERLVEAIKTTLTRAIDAGGSSLRDFTDCDGNVGYFQQQYQVYGRVDQPCRHCGTLIRKVRQSQRSTFFCPECQQ